MIVTSMNVGLSSLVVEENDNLRAVDKLLDVTHKSPFFGDRNSDRTNTPDFNRQLMEKQRELQQNEKKHRDMLKSEDLKLIYEQMKSSQPGKLVDIYR